MLKILKCELKRAFSSKLFWVALLIGIAIAAVSAGQNLADYYEGLKMEATRAEYMGDNPYNPMNPMTTVYNYWIGGDYEGPMTPLFYLLLPLLVCLPFSWSYLTDRKSGYINQSMVHIRKKSDYFFRQIYRDIPLRWGGRCGSPHLEYSHHRLFHSCLSPRHLL